MITCLSPLFIALSCLSIVFSWLLPARLQVVSIAVCTVALLALAAPLSLFILVGSTVLVHLATGRRRPETGALISLLGFLAVLFAYFKWNGAPVSVEAAIVPLGMSFYTLRQIHYIFESYKNRLKSRKFLDFFCYLFFLPTFLVGPIHRYDRFVRDMGRRRWNSSLFSQGLERILFGYFKVVVLAQFLVLRRIAVFSAHFDQIHFAKVFFDSLIMWVNLYFQFSGYSDIAIGFAALAGFEIMENFNYPFLATNVADFWKRWHISLTSWCRDYVYQPVASYTRRPFLSICAAMLSLGLWHQFSFRYILWGVYQGAGITAWHQFRKIKPEFAAKSRLARIPLRIGAGALTLSFIILSYPVTSYIQEELAHRWRQIITCMRF